MNRSWNEKNGNFLHTVYSVKDEPNNSIVTGTMVRLNWKGEILTATKKRKASPTVHRRFKKYARESAERTMMKRF